MKTVKAPRVCAVHMWRQVWGTNPGQHGRRRLFSPLRHPSSLEIFCSILFFFFNMYVFFLCLSRASTKSNTFEVGSYPTKRTPVHCLHFTLRNLLLCQDLSQPHHEGVNEGRSPRVLLTSFTRTQFSPLPLPLSRLSTQLKNSPPSMSMGQDYSCIILYL